jgi:PKD repeat protein
LLTNATSGGEFYAFKVTQAGISTTPVTSIVGLSHGNGAGHMKVNQQFTKLAIGNFFARKIEMFDFNNATGVLSNAIEWPYTFISNDVYYGLEFSPDGSRLYVANLTNVIQYTITSNLPATIVASGVNLSAGLSNYFPASLQLGPDDKIYIASGAIGVINAPDQLGATCDFVQQDPRFLAQVATGYGLPQKVYENILPPPNPIVYQDTCQGVPTRFSIDSTGATRIVWSFGDTASGANNTATVANPTHVFSTPGTYQILVLLEYPCFSPTIQKTITIKNCTPITAIKVGTDTCVGLTHSFQVDGVTESPRFFWNFGDPASGTSDTVTLTGTGAASPTHTFTAPGVYRICVTLREPGGPLYTVCRSVRINQCCVNTITSRDSCLSNPIAFRVSSADLSNNFRWNFGDRNSGTANTSTLPAPTHTFSAPGFYTVTITAEGPCGPNTVTFRKRIISCAAPCVATLALVDSCLANSSRFRVISTYPVQSVTWNFGDPESGAQNLSADSTPQHFFSDTGTYRVSAFVDLECGLRQVVRDVRIIACADTRCQATVPNLVTNNGDQKNATFMPNVPCPTTAYTLTIYNRWGNKIFTTNAPTQGWMPQGMRAGVYYYNLALTYQSGAKETKRGWVEVVE